MAKGSGQRAGAWKRLAAEEAGLPGPEPGPRRRKVDAYKPGGEHPPPDKERWEIPDEWAAVRSADLPGSYRFFARLRDFDFSCPRCGELHLVRHRDKKPVVYTGSRLVGGGGWDPILQRMKCRVCGLNVSLGISAMSVSDGRPSPPPDVVATLSEALRLRAARMGGEWEPSKVAGKGVGVNRLVRVEKGGLGEVGEGQLVMGEAEGGRRTDRANADSRGMALPDDPVRGEG